MNTKVTMIPVAQLHPHPDNPRKDLGDITELTASIKANGVLQNLTVVPRANPDVNYEKLCRQYYGDPTEENRTKLNQFRSTDGYTVIIGHRRLAAAKAAGLMPRHGRTAPRRRPTKSSCPMCRSSTTMSPRSCTRTS